MKETAEEKSKRVTAAAKAAMGADGLKKPVSWDSLLEFMGVHLEAHAKLVARVKALESRVEINPMNSRRMFSSGKRDL